MNIQVLHLVEVDDEKCAALVRELVAGVLRLNLDAERTKRLLDALFAHCGYVAGEFEVEPYCFQYARVTFSGSIAGRAVSFTLC